MMKVIPGWNRVWPAQTGIGQTPSGRLGCVWIGLTSLSWNSATPAPPIPFLNDSGLALAKVTFCMRFGRWKGGQQPCSCMLGKWVQGPRNCHSSHTLSLICCSPVAAGLTVPPALAASPLLASLNPGQILTPGKQTDVSEGKSNHSIPWWLRSK